MALFGRESQADTRRAENIRAWLTARSPHSLFSVMFGLISVVDAFTLVIGVAAGIVAIILAVIARKHIMRNPELLGTRLCYLGFALGVLGITLSFLMATIIYPWLTQQQLQ